MSKNRSSLFSTKGCIFGLSSLDCEHPLYPTSRNFASLATFNISTRDWLPHVTHEETEDLDAILKVCEDYEEERTFYSEAEANRWAEYRERILTAPNTKKPTRRQMTISWLRPLKGLSSGDYQLLCSRAALGRGATRQQVYFHGYGRAQPHMMTLQDNAQRLKQRYAVRNALRYLNIKSNITAWSWKEFMEYPLTPALANEHTVKILHTAMLR